jgi:hypothetical protein
VAAVESGTLISQTPERAAKGRDAPRRGTGCPGRCSQKEIGEVSREHDQHETEGHGVWGITGQSVLKDTAMDRLVDAIRPWPSTYQRTTERSRQTGVPGGKTTRRFGFPPRVNRSHTRVAPVRFRVRGERA